MSYLFSTENENSEITEKMYRVILETAIIIKRKECLLLIRLNTLHTESSFERSLIVLPIKTLKY